jgi:hypothetical protein
VVNSYPAPVHLRARPSYPKIVGLIAFVGVLALSVWSQDVRDGILGILLWDDTDFSPGYSELRFRQIHPGLTENAVRSWLGPPLLEMWEYQPKGLYGCVAVSFAENRVVSLVYSRDCESRDVRTTISKDDVARRLGSPDAVSWSYSRSPSDSNYRRRMVTFFQGKLQRSREIGISTDMQPYLGLWVRRVRGGDADSHLGPEP